MVRPADRRLIATTPISDPPNHLQLYHQLQRFSDQNPLVVVVLVPCVVVVCLVATVDKVSVALHLSVMQIAVIT